MACYGAPVGERCRFCDLDLPPDAVAVMTHLNTHWRQFNLESLSPCVFEPQLDIRVGATPLDPEDLEVSSHMEFQYSYSPQTEPSNLTVDGARCSPLNLTGRPKSTPPPPPPNHHHQHHHQTMGAPLVLPPPPHPFDAGGGAPPPPCVIPHQPLPPIHAPQDTAEEQGAAARRRRRPEECHACGRAFLARASLDAHLLDAHVKDNGTGGGVCAPAPPSSGKRYKCAVCDGEFSYKEELLEHAESHAKPYRCDLCGAGLSHVSALRRHRLAHSGHRPHRCEVCGRGFFQKCDLQRHYATHGRSKRYECGACKKKYSSPHFLENHKCRAPEEPKPFRCNICGEGCTNNMAWSYHMWKHTKNPIFVPFQEKFVMQAEGT